MPTVTLNFNHDINASVQINDVVYYVTTTPVGISGIPDPDTTTPSGIPWAATTTPHYTETRENVIMIGPITNIIPWDGNQTVIEAEMDAALSAQHGPPQLGDFIMFSKDNKANLSSLLGYYSSIKLRNNSVDEADMFSVGADFVESSI